MAADGQGNSRSWEFPPEAGDAYEGGEEGSGWPSSRALAGQGGADVMAYETACCCTTKMYTTLSMMVVPILK